MNEQIFTSLEPTIDGNPSLRIPQREAYVEIAKHFDAPDGAREIGVVLPVGCGKSGLLALTPFAAKARRALLVAPNLTIADQLLRDLTPTSPQFFYQRRAVLSGPPFPEPAEIRGAKTNVGDLADADIVITNIQQLQRAENRWLEQLSEDFFDLIMFDEGHHNVAQSWETLRSKFPAARIVNVSGTPSRADGKLMAGEIIYSYPIAEAVRNGYVKRVTGHCLNPRTLRYIRREDDREVEVALDEVRRLGEQDASFRRSIVSSEETLTTIVDASIRKLMLLRERTGEKRLKIIASALNMEHCKQIVAKYAERSLRADFVHSKVDSRANEAVHAKLENHELDVIVQVRKLGEGFDHPFLSVAAVFSLYASLSPFVQFVGRVMRIIPGVDPQDAVNEGVVVFHVGANITGVWKDFQDFAEADREWLAALVDEEVDQGDGQDRDPFAEPRIAQPLPTVTGQGEVLLEDIDLIQGDPRVAEALRMLRDAGVSTGAQFEQLQRYHPTKQATRRSKQKLLDERIKTQTGKALAQAGLQAGGHDLDKARRGRDNFQCMKAAIDKQVNSLVGRSAGSRGEWGLGELDRVLLALDQLVQAAVLEVVDGG